MRRVTAVVLSILVGALVFLPGSAQAGVGDCGCDYNADGFSDLAVGVPDENLSLTGFNEGAVHVLYGGPGGLSSAGDQVFHQDSAGMNDTAEDFDLFGSALVGSPAF